MKRSSLVSAVQALPQKHRLSFFDRCPPALQAELLELRELYQAGKLPSHVSAVRMRDEVQARAPMKIAITTFREWLRGVR